ncbi:MAG: tetratricopeptide repeat protein [Rickettsiella sp.]|nr:tetratricopeptide repeat protein [Rickettsiella sp.]
MNELAELEQVERIKKWCRDYGFGIIAGIIFAIILSMFWYYWRQTQENNLILASITYENLLNDSTQSDNRAYTLIQKYPNTPYASLAALQLAKQAVNQNKLTEAEKQLTWVTQHGKNETLRAMARVRLARVLLAENQPEHALKILDENDNTIYQPLVFEEKGNIFLHLKDSTKALQNYLAAEKLFSKNAIDQPLLSMQINSLD